MTSMRRCFAAVIVAAFATVGRAEDEGTGEEALRIGAAIYEERCVLCHGPKGMGDGLLAVRIDDYPDTNLLTAARAVTPEQVKRAVEWGGFREAHANEHSPPWVYEMSERDVRNVAAFVHFLRRDTAAALDLLARIPLPPRTSGEAVFETRCAICHGNEGHGNGRLSVVVKAPPPANLARSRLSRTEMTRIITGGGESVGRSPQMPPWGQELSDQYIELVTNYLLELRAGNDEPH